MPWVPVYVCGIRTQARLNSPPAVSKYKTLLAHCAQLSKYFWYWEYWLTSEAYVVRSIFFPKKEIWEFEFAFSRLEKSDSASNVLQVLFFYNKYTSRVTCQFIIFWNVLCAISTGGACKNIGVGLVLSFQVSYGWKCFHSCPSNKILMPFKMPFTKLCWWQLSSLLLLYQLLTLGSQEHCCCPS